MLMEDLRCFAIIHVTGRHCPVVAGSTVFMRGRFYLLARELFPYSMTGIQTVRDSSFESGVLRPRQVWATPDSNGLAVCSVWMLRIPQSTMDFAACRGFHSRPWIPRATTESLDRVGLWTDMDWPFAVSGCLVYHGFLGRPWILWHLSSRMETKPSCGMRASIRLHF